jgi:hypothetical protein
MASPEDKPDPCRQEIGNAHHDKEPNRSQPRLAGVVEAERCPLVLIVRFP